MDFIKELKKCKGAGVAQRQLPSCEMSARIEFRRSGDTRGVALTAVDAVFKALDAYVLRVRWNPYDHMHVRLGDHDMALITFTDLRPEQVREADPRVQEYKRHPKYRVCPF